MDVQKQQNTIPCTLNPNTFHGQAAYQYILNSSCFDKQRSKPEEGLYVVDWNKLGVMNVEQEYAVCNFMCEEFSELVELEYEDIHSMTICFRIDSCVLNVGIYDLKHDKMIAYYLRSIDEVDDLDLRCFKNI